MATPTGPDDDGGSDTPLIRIKGEDYALVPADKYQQLLEEVASLDTSRLNAVHALLNAAKATPEIGAVESAGEHKGEIYGGILPSDNKPIWFSAAPRLMDHYAAAAWAKEQGGSLPTRTQGNYLTSLKGKGGAFTEIFNRGNSFPAGFVWLAEPEPNNRNYAWCQRLSSGYQNMYDLIRDIELPVLSVFR